jgi:hypothetical protein
MIGVENIMMIRGKLDLERGFEAQDDRPADYSGVGSQFRYPGEEIEAAESTYNGTSCARPLSDVSSAVHWYARFPVWQQQDLRYDCILRIKKPRSIAYWADDRAVERHHRLGSSDKAFRSPQ